MSKYYQDRIEAIVSLYFDQRSLFKNQSLKDPNFMEYHYKEALQVPEKWAEKKRKSFDSYGGQSSEEENYGEADWFSTHCLFSEVLTNPMLYFYALIVENPRSYKQFFKSTAAVIKCPYADKLELFVNKDIEDSTSLLNIWETNSWRK